MRKKTNYLLLIVFFISVSCRNNSKIDRYQQVTRFNINNSIIDSLSSLSVGNTEFSFTTDLTGLQTFPEFYSHGIPLETRSDWGLNRGEDPGNDYRYYLGLIGLQILKENGQEISINDIKDPLQMLNLWTGEIDSKFKIEGVPVHIRTVCHSDYDLISVKVISRLIGKKRLRIKLNFFPGMSSTTGYDFNSPEKQTTKILADTNNYSIFARTQDKNNYYVLVWRNSAQIKKINQHMYYLEPQYVDSVYSFSCQFMKNLASGRMQNFGETEAASKKNWEKFWNSVNAVEFKGFKEPGAKDLERCAFISKYFTRIQSNVHLYRTKR
jgi:hypothetical protein